MPAAAQELAGWSWVCSCSQARLQTQGTHAAPCRAWQGAPCKAGAHRERGSAWRGAAGEGGRLQLITLSLLLGQVAAQPGDLSIPSEPQ